MSQGDAGKEAVLRAARVLLKDFIPIVDMLWSSKVLSMFPLSAKAQESEHWTKGHQRKATSSLALIREEYRWCLRVRETSYLWGISLFKSSRKWLLPGITG